MPVRACTYTLPVVGQPVASRTCTCCTHLPDTTCNCPSNRRALPKHSGRMALQRNSCTGPQAWQQRLTRCLIFDRTPFVAVYHFFIWRCVLLAARRRFCVLPCSVRNLDHAYGSPVPIQTSCYQHALCSRLACACSQQERIDQEPTNPKQNILRYVQKNQPSIQKNVAQQSNEGA